MKHRGFSQFAQTGLKRKEQKLKHTAFSFGTRYNTCERKQLPFSGQNWVSAEKQAFCRNKFLVIWLFQSSL